MPFCVDQNSSGEPSSSSSFPYHNAPPHSQDTILSLYKSLPAFALPPSESSADLASCPPSYSESFLTAAERHRDLQDERRDDYLRYLSALQASGDTDDLGGDVDYPYQFGGGYVAARTREDRHRATFTHSLDAVYAWRMSTIIESCAASIAIELDADEEQAGNAEVLDDGDYDWLEDMIARTQTGHSCSNHDADPNHPSSSDEDSTTIDGNHVDSPSSPSSSGTSASGSSSASSTCKSLFKFLMMSKDHRPNKSPISQHQSEDSSSSIDLGGDVVMAGDAQVAERRVKKVKGLLRRRK